METSKEYKLKDSFICDRCRNICKAGCHEKLLGIQNGTIKVGTKEYEDNKDLIGRKLENCKYSNQQKRQSE